MYDIYLIEELVLDCFENDANSALKWKPIGYTSNLKYAKRKVESGKIYTSKDCWALALSKGVSQYRYSKLEELYGNLHMR